MQPLTNQEKFIFTREMETILSSGIAMDEGLSLIEENAQEQNICEAAKIVRNLYFELGTLSKAIIESKLFDLYMEKLVEIGEINGDLDIVMKELCFYYEREEDMNNRTKDATTYPFVLLCMMTIIVGILVFKVLPIFERVMNNMGTSLNPLSKVMMDFGKGFSIVAFVFLLISFICIVGFTLASKSNPDLKDRVLSNFPLTKNIHAKTALAKMTFALSLFVSSGYPLEETMKYIPELITHKELKEKILRVIKGMENGESFVDCILKEKVFNGSHASMLTIGIKSGRQEEVLKKLVDLYQKDIIESTSHFLNIIEPTIVAILSLIVGIILLSIMLPLMGIMSSI